MTFAVVTEATMSDGSTFPFAPLYNVTAEDGRRFVDLTPSQLQQVIERHGYEVVKADHEA